jgi:hypothetical protein
MRFPRVRQVKIYEATCAVGSSPFTIDVSAKLGKLPYLNAGGFAIGLEGVRTAGASTLDCKLQGSNDGTNFLDIVAFTQLSASGRELKLVPYITEKLHLYLVVGTASTWTVKVYVYPALLGAQITA